MLSLVDVVVVDCCSCPYVVIDFPGIIAWRLLRCAALRVLSSSGCGRVRQKESRVQVEVANNVMLNTCRNRSGGRTCDPN